MALRVGTSGDNTLRGGRENDILSGLAGNDVLEGMGGNDALSGGLGADTLEGGPGNDLLFSEGSDALDGGAGRDAVILTDSFDLDEVFRFEFQNAAYIEAIQDVPESSTQVTVHLNILSGAEDKTLRIAMGDGDDTVRVINDGTWSLNVTGGKITVGGTMAITLDGVETLEILDRDNRVTGFYDASALSAGVGPATSGPALAGAGSAAARAAELVDSSADPTVSEEADISPVADALASLLEQTAPLEQVPQPQPRSFTGDDSLF